MLKTSGASTSAPALRPARAAGTAASGAVSVAVPDLNGLVPASQPARASAAIPRNARVRYGADAMRSLTVSARSVSRLSRPQPGETDPTPRAPAIISPQWHKEKAAGPLRRNSPAKTRSEGNALRQSGAHQLRRMAEYSAGFRAGIAGRPEGNSATPACQPVHARGCRAERSARASANPDGHGSVAEWFKALVLKTSVRGTVPWVRIPPLPPITLNYSSKTMNWIAATRWRPCLGPHKVCRSSDPGMRPSRRRVFLVRSVPLKPSVSPTLKESLIL